MADDRENYEERKLLWEAHQRERGVLFSNEAALIATIQAVSGGALIAALANKDQFMSHLGPKTFMTVVSLMSLALMLSVAAFFFRHQYMMWDVKSAASGHADEERQRRGRLAGNYLILTRWAMKWGTLLVVFGIGTALVSAWFGNQAIVRGQVISTVGLFLVLFGSAGIIVLAATGASVTQSWELQQFALARFRWFSVTGYHLWFYSWIAILIGTMLQIIGVWW